MFLLIDSSIFMYSFIDAFASTYMHARPAGSAGLRGTAGLRAGARRRRIKQRNNKKSLSAVLICQFPECCILFIGIFRGALFRGPLVFIAINVV